MNTVFLSGSRTLGRLNDAVRNRLNNMIEKKMNIIVGDANGADKAMQSHLAKSAYDKVTVYYVGGACRNNVGTWDVVNVMAESHLTGRDFYAQKDKEMARITDFGFILWDGESAGSVHNMFELIRNRKQLVVYYSPEKEFYHIESSEKIRNLLKKCTTTTYQAITKKHNISQTLRKLDEKQHALEF